jgi:ATP-dependent DNA helicase RecG
VPARNRRIGELLKELRLAEGRGTGLPKIRRAMRQNGSPDPIFDFDDARTWFRVRLPAHPEMVVHLALREAAYLELTGDRRAAFAVLQRTMVDHPESAELGVALIRSLGAAGELDGAREIVARSQRGAGPGMLIALADVLREAGHEKEAGDVLERLPAVIPGVDAVEAALLELELDHVSRAHQLFLAAGEAVLRETRALHGFARSKIELASSRSRQSSPNRGARGRLWREAEDLLERALQLEARDVSLAWLWADLAVVRERLGRPRAEVEARSGARVAGIGSAPPGEIPAALSTSPARSPIGERAPVSRLTPTTAPH